MVSKILNKLFDWRPSIRNHRKNEKQRKKMGRTMKWFFHLNYYIIKSWFWPPRWRPLNLADFHLTPIIWLISLSPGLSYVWWIISWVLLLCIISPYSPNSSRSSGLWTLFSRVRLTWAYLSVVSRFRCPKRVWMYRKLVPFSRRWVAKLCRRQWMLTFFFIFAVLQHW